MKFLAKSLLVGSALGLAAFSQAQTVKVTSAFAPNIFGAPSYFGWEANAISALMSGANSFGTPGTPEHYTDVTNLNFTAEKNIVTNFSMWMGQANPAAPFENELGNRLTAGAAIVSPSEQFNLSQVSDSMSGGAYSALDVPTFTYSGFNYQPWRVGINYGLDLVKGGGDDIVYDNNNDGNLLVHELYMVGIGNATESLLTSPGATLQDKVYGVAAMIPGHTTNFNFMLDLGSGTFVGNSSVNFQPVPEPMTMTILAGGALAMLRRRKK